MRLSDLEVEDMPSAFKELEELSKELQKARVSFNERFLTMASSKNSPKGTQGPKLGSFEAITELKQKMFTSFARTFEQELNARSFEIFKASGFLAFVKASGSQEFLYQALQEDDVFSGLLEASSINPLRIMELMLEVGPYLSSSQIDQAWMAAKLCLRRHDVPWLADVGVKSEEEFFGREATDAKASQYFKDTKAPQYVDSLARPYLEAPNVSLETLFEASFLTLPLGILQYDPREPFFEGGNLKALGLDALALAVFNFNRPVFEMHQEANGVDPRVAEVLITSWRGDLRSFLVAAKSLSADSDFKD